MTTTAPRSPDERDDRIGRSTIVVGLGTGLSRLTGLAKVGVVAYVLGFTRLTDSYNLANTTPNILYELALGGVLTAALVPFFVDRLERQDDEAVSTLVLSSLAALVAVVVAVLVTAPWVASLYTLRVHGSGSAEQRELIVALLRWFAPQILFYGLVALSTALLHARRRFTGAAFVPVLNNLVVIATFLVLDAVATETLTVRSVLDRPLLLAVLGAGTTAGVAATALAVAGAFRTSGVHWSLPRLGHPVLVEVLRLSGWSTGYVVANQVALWVVLVIAAERAGDLSAYQTAFVFFQLPHGLLAVSIMTTFAPGLASRARDEAALREHFRAGLRLLLLVTAPAAAGYLALASPIVQSALQRGAVSAASASRTADVLTAFAVGLVPFSVFLYTMRGFYATLDARTPFLVNLGQNAANVLLALALAPAFDAVGLGLAYAIAYAIAAAAALVLFARRIGGVGRAAWKTTGRAGACAAVMAVTVRALDAWLGPGAVELRAVAGVVVGIAVYGGLLALVGRDEIAALVRRDRSVQGDGWLGRATGPS